MTYGAQPPAAYFGDGNDSDRLEQTADHTPDPQWAVDANGNVTGLVGPAGRLAMHRKALGNTAVILGDSITAFYNLVTAGITITSAGNTATVSQSSHQLLPGQDIRVYKSTRAAQDGDVTVNVIDANSWSYTLETADTGAGTASIINPLRRYDGGWFAWVQLLMGQPFRVLKNAGVPGDQTSNILARLAEDCLDYEPRWVFEMSGVNDAISDVTAAEIIANKYSIYDQILATGAQLVALTILPMGSGHASFSTARTQVIFAVNDAIRTYAMTHDGVILVDACAQVIDPTSASGAAKTGYLTDNLHPTAVGAHAVGNAVATALSGKVPVNQTRPISVFDDADGDAGSWNILDNGMMQGTSGTHVPSSGGSTGTVPTDWTCRHTVASASSCVASIVSRSDGFGSDYQMACTATANAQTFEARSADMTAKLTAGDKVKFGVEVDMSSVSNMNVFAELVIFAGGLTSSIRALTFGSTTHPAAYTGYFESDEPVVIPASMTACYIKVQARSTSTSGAATVKIGRAWVRRS